MATSQVTTIPHTPSHHVTFNMAYPIYLDCTYLPPKISEITLNLKTSQLLKLTIYVQPCLYICAYLYTSILIYIQPCNEIYPLCLIMALVLIRVICLRGLKRVGGGGSLL